MDEADLTRLIDFHYWARDRVLDAVAQLTSEHYTRDMGNSFASVRDTLVHLYSAEWAWLQRWRGTSPTAMLDPVAFPDVPTLRTAWLEHEGRLRAFVAALGPDAVRRPFVYKAFDGRPHTSPFGEMLQHVVNHGTYHRGQVTTMLRQLGAPPAKSVELIVFHRERRETP